VTLRDKIEQEIRERGPIPFSRYMELCLYDPEHGYYSRDVEKFGKAGDFYTSSDVHAVFGRLLARQFEEMWRTLGSPEKIEILELGAGRGLFAQDVLDWSEKKFPAFFQALHYTLVETSPSLRNRLEATFRERIAAAKISVLSSTAEGGRRPIEQRQEREGHGFSHAEKLAHSLRASAPEVPVLIFANEFFDAMPVEVLSQQGALRVDTGDGRFVEQWVPASAAELEFLDRYGVHPIDHARTEVALLAQRQMAEVAANLQRGFLIAIDYGYTREQQLAGRYLDTVMTYRRHTAGPNPYEAPGEQDITVHVNFSALAAAAERGGMHVHRLLTQSQFLLGIGETTQFADAFEECRLPQERAKVALQLKHLITPEGMGETFQVLVGSKDVKTETAEDLSGFSFGKSGC
jgi:SAM-dependent MidA family methyltransferase